MELLCKYSPFNNVDDLLSQFDKISKGSDKESESGTLICIYNLKLNADGETEFFFYRR